MRNVTLLIFCFFSLCTVGCENTDTRLVTEAGLDAVRAVALSDKAVQQMAVKSSAYADSKKELLRPPVNMPGGLNG